jgi:bifunctional ADP-heptose synthase (sugar kinase/adenylyltransferase)
LQPDLLVKGGDWPVAKIVGAAEVLAAGGGVLSIPLVGTFSTTALIERIQQGGGK